MKAFFLLITSLVINFFVIFPSQANFFPAKSTAQIKHTCYCPGCDLGPINLSYFQPGTAILDKSPKALCAMNCDFKGARLERANLSNANFDACIGGLLTTIKETNFSNALLIYANLSNSLWSKADFTAANLAYSNLTNSVFYVVSFKNANFTFANLTNTQSKKANMNGQGSDFSNANFTFAYLKNAKLYGNFRGANFSHAYLIGAQLSTSLETMTKEDSPDDLWTGTNFSYTDLSQALLSDAAGNRLDLRKAILCHTRMGDGHIENRDCKFTNDGKQDVPA